MRSLSNIFSKSGLRDAEREILFEDELWCIYRRPDYCDGQPLFMHRCAQATCALDIDPGDDPAHGVCGNEIDGGCGEHIPEKLQGLWLLYTWER